MNTPDRKNIPSLDLDAGTSGNPGQVRSFGVKEKLRDEVRDTSAAKENTPKAQSGVSEKNAPKKKHKKGPIIAVVIAIVAIIIAILLVLTMCGPVKGRRQGDAGQLQGKTAEEVQAELNRSVEEGMFNISIASVIAFPDGESPGEVRIENVPGNPYLMKVEITRDDTGDVIYTTDLIEPNHHIQADTLDVDLPAGSYNCTATFSAYDLETEESVGQAAAKVTIDVKA